MFARQRLPIIAGLAAFLVFVGSGSAWSYWTTQVSTAGKVTTDTVAVSHAGFTAPAETKYLPSSGQFNTRSFTVTNGSKVSGTATVSITSSEQYAANFPVSVWRLDSGACTDATPTSGVTTGTWGSVSSTLTLKDSVTATMCVRTTLPDWKSITDPSGGRTFTPMLSVSLNAQGWVATTPTPAAHTQRTAGMYPLSKGFFDPAKSSWHTIRSRAAQGICLDASGSGGANTNVISWTCHQESNQRWQFLPVSGGDQSFVTIRPRHAPSTRLTQTATGVQQIAASASSDAQRWYVQSSGSFYQLVSAVDGMCLGMNTTSANTAMKVVECDQPAAQLTFPIEALTMSAATSGPWWSPTTTVTLRFGSTITMTGMMLQKKSGSGWADVAAVSVGATSVSFNGNDISNGGSAEYRIVFAGSADVAYGNIVLRRSGNEITALGGIGS